jgi:hypothetical protein
MQQRVVQRGVEDGPLLGRAAGDADPRQLASPRLLGAVPDRFQRRAGRVLGVEVRDRVGGAHVRDAHPDVDRRSAGEPQVRSGASARLWPAVRVERGASAGRRTARRDNRVGPRADRGERLVEFRVEVQGVVAAPALGAEVPAEVPARHVAADGVGGRVDPHMRVGADQFRVRGAHEHRRRLTGREREPAGRRARGGAQLRPGAGVQPHRVVPGARRLARVRERAGIDRVGGVELRRGGDLADVREERDVTGRACTAGAGQVGQAEPADPRGVVPVPAGGRGPGRVAARVLRAERRHPERQHGTGEHVAAVRRADERIDRRRRVGR